MSLFGSDQSLDSLDSILNVSTLSSGFLFLSFGTFCESLRVEYAFFVQLFLFFFIRGIFLLKLKARYDAIVSTIAAANFFLVKNLGQDRLLRVLLFRFQPVFTQFYGFAKDFSTTGRWHLLMCAIVSNQRRSQVYRNLACGPRPPQLGM